MSRLLWMCIFGWVMLQYVVAEQDDPCSCKVKESDIKNLNQNLSEIWMYMYKLRNVLIERITHMKDEQRKSLIEVENVAEHVYHMMYILQNTTNVHKHLEDSESRFTTQHVREYHQNDHSHPGESHHHHESDHHQHSSHSHSHSDDHHDSHDEHHEPTDSHGDSHHDSSYEHSSQEHDDYHHDHHDDHHTSSHSDHHEHKDDHEHKDEHEHKDDHVHKNDHDHKDDHNHEHKGDHNHEHKGDHNHEHKGDHNHEQGDHEHKGGHDHANDIQPGKAHGDSQSGDKSSDKNDDDKHKNKVIKKTVFFGPHDDREDRRDHNRHRTHTALRKHYHEFYYPNDPPLKLVTYPLVEDYDQYYFAMSKISPNSGLDFVHQQDVHGEVTFFQKKTGGSLGVHVRVTGFRMGDMHRLRLQELSKQNRDLDGVDSKMHRHAMHVHEFGDMSNGCESMGGHYNPTNVSHGGPHAEQRHIGDFGNIECTDYGVANLIFNDTVASLMGPYSILNKGLIIHADEDDYGLNPDEPKSITSGNSGFRIGCGIIHLISEPNLNSYRYSRWATQYRKQR